MGFLRIGIDFDFWYDGLKISWCESFYKIREGVKKYVDNVKVLVRV